MKVVHGTNPLSGRLIYRIRDLAFDFIFESRQDYLERFWKLGIGEMSINDLTVEVLLPTRSLIYAWGYSHYLAWKRTKLPSLDYTSGVVILDEPLDIEPPKIPRYGRNRYWNVFYDPSQNLCCMAQGEAIAANHEQNIEFSTGMVATVIDNVMECLWLRPEWIS